MGGKKFQPTPVEKINNIQLQSSCYGQGVPIRYGTNRGTGNLIWYGNFRAIPHTTKQQAGKGLGKTTSTNTTYTYEAAVQMSLGEGPIVGVGSVWKGKEQTNLTTLGLTLFTGTPGQAPWSFLSGYSNPTNWTYEQATGYSQRYVDSAGDIIYDPPAYRNQALGYDTTAYLAASAYDLGDSGSVPNHGFEVRGKFIYGGAIQDANPKDFVTDFLTSPQYGVGMTAVGDLTDFSNYCRANGLFISPQIESQQPANAHLGDILDTLNTDSLWSDGVLKLLPRGDTAVTGNGATYTPNMTPIYDLDDDDFTADNPLRVIRKNPSDAYNRVVVEFNNRANSYNNDVASAEDQNAVEQHGLRPAPNVQAPWITESSVAKWVAEMLKNRALYIRNEYEFGLVERYALLEPGDKVTVNDLSQGIDRVLVRILEIEEDEDGYLVKAEDIPVGVSAPALYQHDDGLHYVQNINDQPGSAETPFIFELPADPTTTGLAIGIAAGKKNSDPIYGGCNVWVSVDEVNYRQVGSINGSSRHGVLRAAMGTTGGAQVELLSDGQLESVSLEEATNGVSLIAIGQEYFTYQVAALMGTNEYDLSVLTREWYGTTPATHPLGAQFALIDPTICRIEDLDLDLIGTTLYFKLTAFNTYEGGEEQLDAVDAYPYTVTGYMYDLSTQKAIIDKVNAMFTPILTNEAATVPALADGTVTSYSDANGEFQIWSGAVEVSAQFTFSIPAGGNPQGLTGPYSGSPLSSTGDYSVTGGIDLAENSATLTMRATGTGPFVGVVIDKIFNVTKAKGGADGSSPALVTLSTTHNAFHYDQTDTPVAQTTILVATRQNPGAGTTLWLVTRSTGSTNTVIAGPDTAANIVAGGFATSTTGNDNLTINQSTYNTILSTGNSITFEARLSTDASRFDRVSIVKIKDGVDGADGLNSATITIYQRAASVPTLPSATTTYTFSTKTLTGLNNGWSTTIPAGTNPLYASAATAASSGTTDTIAAGEWSGAVVLAQNGTDGSNGANGLNVASVFIYQRATSAPAVPSATVTYTFAGGGISGLNNGWSATIPTGTNPIYVSTATAANTTATDNIATGEWATPRVLAQNGADGAPGTPGAPGADGAPGINTAILTIYQRSATTPTLPSATTTYTFSTKSLTGLNNGWSTTIPAGTAPIWATSATAASSADTDTIAAGEWSGAVVLAQNGADGSNGSNGANGLNVSTAWIYQRAASAPSVPSASVTFTFATGAMTGLNNGWTTTIPSTGAGPLWVTTATASNTGATDTITSGEWATPTILAQDSTGTFTPVNKNGMTINGSNFTKTGGTNGVWDGSVHSVEGYAGNVRVIGQVGNSAHHIMVGLNGDPNTNADYTSIDCAAYCDAGAFRVYLAGGLYGTSGTVSSGDFLYVQRRGSNVEFGVIGEASPRVTLSLATINSLAGLSLTESTKLYFDTSFYETSSALNGCALLPLGLDGENGSDGAPGVNAKSMSLAPDAVVVTASYTGVTTSGQLPRYVTVTTLDGTTPTSPTLSVTVSDSTNITASVSGSTVTISVINVDAGWVDVSAAGYPTKRISLSRSRAGQPGSDQTQENTDLGIVVTTGSGAESFAGSPTTSTMLLKASPSGELHLDAMGEYYADQPPTGVRRITLKAMAYYRVAGSGSGWSTFSGPHTGSQAEEQAGVGGFPGSINIGGPKTGLTADTLYEVGIELRRNTTTGSTGAIGNLPTTLSQTS